MAALAHLAPQCAVVHRRVSRQPQHGKPRPSVGGRRCLAVRMEGAKNDVEQDKGWVYNNLVKGRTFDDRMAKLTEEVAARKGKVDTAFNDAFGYTAWIEVHRALTAAEQKSVTPEEALELTKTQNALLLDVREARYFEQVHAEGSKSAPFFRPVQGSDLKSNLRRLGYVLLYGVFSGTERNPEFVKEAIAAVDGNKERPLIVLCGRGGSLETTAVNHGRTFRVRDRLFGNPSRSLKAIYELREAGFTDLYHLQGGFNQWVYDGYPVVEP